MTCSQTKSDAELLHSAQELERQYAEAAAFDGSHGTVTKYQVVWDNGTDACGSFPELHETFEAAKQAADDWAAEANARDGIDPQSAEAYTADVLPVQVPVTPSDADADEMGELRNAALNHLGQP